MTEPTRSPVTAWFLSTIIKSLGSGTPSAPPASEWNDEERAHRSLEKKYWLASLALSVLVILGAAGSALFAGLTFGETRRQADLAQANLIATTRAWLELPDVQGLTGVEWRKASPFSPGGLRLTVDVTSSNAGASPALDVTLYLVFWEVVPGPLSDLDEHVLPREGCAEGGADADRGTLFMKSAYARRSVVDVTLRQVAAVGERMPLAHGNAYRFLLCGRYRVLGEDGLHLTAKAFELARAGGAAVGAQPSAAPEFGDVQGTLVFRRLPFGEYAD